MKAGDLYWAELAMANGIPGFTVELEGRFESRFDENQPVVRIGVRGVVSTLRKLGMIPTDTSGPGPSSALTNPTGAYKPDSP